MTKVALAVIAVAASAFALPMCTTQSAAVYQSYGSDGCVLGAFTIKNLDWGSLGDPSSIAVLPEDVQIIPTLQSGRVGLSFTSDRFFAGSGQTITGFLEYLIDPPPPILDDFFMSLDARTPQGGGSATISALVCAGGRLISCSGGELLQGSLVHLGAGNPGNILDINLPFTRPVSTVDVRLRIDLIGGPNGTSQITGATQTTSLVPEPGVAMLAGAGLIGLAGFGRIRRSRTERGKV